MVRKLEKPMRMPLKTGDTVYILSGKDRGKTGKVIRVFPKENRIVVEGINLATKHQRRRPTGVRAGTQQQYGIIQMPAPLFASKVKVVCPHCDKPTRVARQRGERNRWVRVCKRCGEVIDAT